MAKASRKAPEDWPSPKAGATSYGSDGREASWTAPVLWRFLTGAEALNTYEALGYSRLSFRGSGLPAQDKLPKGIQA